MKMIDIKVAMLAVIFLGLAIFSTVLALTGGYGTPHPFIALVIVVFTIALWIFGIWGIVIICITAYCTHITEHREGDNV